MKLMIDIPDTTYAFVKQLQGLYIGRGNCKTVQQTVINAIKFGIPQPQGKWKPDKARIYNDSEDTWECSVCNEPFTLIEGTPKDNLYKFCPNCGAYMGGADHE